MKHTTEYLLVRALLLFVRLLPFSFAVRAGGFLGIAAFYLFPVRKNVALLNLRTAFPEKSPHEISRICRATYRQFGMTLFEYLSLYTVPRERIREMVSFEPPDLVQQLLARNRGAIGVTGHFGSFELMGVAIRARGMPIDVVVKAMKNHRVEEVLDFIRRKNELGVVKVKDGFSRVADSIRKKRLIALVADQDAGEKGVFVDFFGISSSTPVGPAMLALRSGAPMFTGFIVRERTTTYRVLFSEVSCEDLPEDKQEKIREITRRYTAHLEDYIRRYPDHYFWMHKRWKSAGLYQMVAGT